MTHIAKFCLASAGVLALSGAAAAQTTAPASPPPPAAADPSAGTFSTDDVKKFAAAAVELNRIQADTSVAETEKQPKMLAAVQKQGLAPEKFNAIARAAETDPALQQQIQAAASSTAAPSASPAP